MSTNYTTDFTSSSPVAAGSWSAVGHVTGASLAAKVAGFFTIFSHFVDRLATLRDTSGAPLRFIMAVMAALMAAELGALPNISKLRPSLIRGRIGHPYGLVGFGISGISPSPSLSPGQLALITCGDICSSCGLPPG